MFDSANFNNLPAFVCAHETNIAGATGTTVFLAPEGAACGVDVRGGGPATRETDLLKPENLVEEVQGVVISGGSAMGLAAASGVANVLAAEKIGFDVSVSYVPVVPSACLFDLTLGENTAPNEAMGEAAARKALSLRGSDKDRNLEQGNVGAGTGASVGKMGEASQCMKSGFGWAGVQSGGLVVVASVAVNAAGNVYNFDGTPLAGVVTPEGAIEDARELMVNNSRSSDECFSAGSTATPCENTTLGVVLTNAHLTKAQATKVSQITQDAYARRIKPVHTLSDGDAIFTMASGEVEAPVDVVAVLATEAMEQAIVSAINHAQSAYGLPCAADIR